MKKYTKFSIGQIMKSSFIMMFVCTIINVQAFASENTILNLEVSLTAYDSECGNANNGAVTSIVSGGVPPYTYEWSNGETTPGISGLAPGSYTLTLTDAVQNEVTASATVGQEDSDITLDLNASYETCDGSCDGNVSVNASGGTGSLTYLWNTGDDFVVVYNACAGLYTVTVTDENGCTAEGSIELELSPEGIWLMTSSTDATCASSNDGTAHVSVMTGEAPYVIEWSDGQMGEDISGLAPGTYTVTVTDANGCFNTDEVTIEEGDSGIELELNASYETCDGSCDGNVSVNASGGSGGYTYLWNTGDDFVVVDDACAGLYTVTVTDDVGCSAVGSIELELSPEGVWLMTSHTDVTCNGGSDGTAHVSVMAGEAPYEITWNTTPPQMGEDATGLSAGTYIVTAVDANGCSNSEEVIISEPSAIEIVVNYTENADCSLNNGLINLGVLGGTPGYTYLWSNGEITQDIENLPAGTYTVTVTDTVGCTAVSAPIIIEDESNIVIVVESVVDATCGLDNGSIDISVSGGTPGYTYEWSNGADTEDIENLGAGTYSVTVTDANGCTGVEGPIVVGDSPAIVISVDEVTNADCGENNGSINISISGGTPGFTYEWSNGVDTEDIENLSPGDYTVTVTDANGCTAIAGPIAVEEEPCCPEILIQSIVVVETPCALSEGIAIIEMVGDNAAFDYNWSPNVGVPNAIGNSRTELPSGIYEVTISDPNQPNCPSIVEIFSVGVSDFPPVAVVSTTPATCEQSNGTAEMSEPGFIYLWCNGATEYNPTNLPAGTCVVEITDPITGCIDFQTVVIETFNPLTIDVTVNNSPDCGVANGSVSIDVGGGSNNYSYEWSNGDSTQTVSDLSSGIYCITVTDNGSTGCVKDTCFVLTDNVPGAAIEIEEPISIACVGTNDATVVYDITYDSAFAQPAVITFICEDGNEYDNGSLPPGNCCILVTDANGCLAASVCFDIETPSQIDMDLAINNTCDPTPGIEIVETIGGTAPYTYDWADLPGNDNPEDRPDLETGAYGVTVTDANGCTAGINDLMVIDTCACPPIIISSVVVVETNCGESTGQANVTVVDAGTTAYIYEWSPMVGNGPLVANLSAGVYSVTITNAAEPQCNIVEEFSVGNSNGPQVDVVTTPSLCSSSDGSTTFSNTTFTYTWNDPNIGITGNVVNDLAAGTYFVTITDPSDPDCINVQTVVIEEEPSFEVSYTINTLPDCNASNGSVTVSPSTPGDYSYSWGNSATVDNLSSGVYEVTVTDNVTNCTASLIFVLTDNVPNTSLIINGESFVSCPGTMDGYIDYTVDPGVTVEIQDASGNVYMNNELAPGTYCLIATDINDCISGGECVEVGSPDQIDVDVAIYDEECGEPGEIQLVEVIGGSGNYEYDWSPNTTTTDSVATNLSTGQYTFTVTDANGCEVSETVFVADDPNALSVLISGDSTICGTPNELSVSAIGDSFEWTNEEGEVIGTTSNIMIDTVGVFYVEVVNGNCIDTDSIIITPGEFEIDIADVNTCFGTSEILNEGGSLDYNYQWSPSDILDDPSAPSPMATTNVTTEFTVTITDVLGVCEDVVTVNYEVEEEVELSIDSDGPELCSGDLAMLTAISSNGQTFECMILQI